MPAGRMFVPRVSGACTDARAAGEARVRLRDMRTPRRAAKRRILRSSMVRSIGACSDMSSRVGEVSFSSTRRQCEWLREWGREVGQSQIYIAQVNESCTPDR